MDSIRKVDELGRVVLPAEVRKNLNIGERDQLDISVVGSKIILQKRNPSCIVCDSMEDMQKFNDKDLCGRCNRKLLAS